MPDSDELSIRGEYERLGADAYYRAHGATYRNPHELEIEKALHAAMDRWKPDLSHVLDLAAGSGEATLILKAAGAGNIEGIDPYTFAAYEARVGSPCERQTFERIADGGLAGRAYSLIVCCFAMHLLDESRLPGLAMQLAMISPELWIVTPHKRPHLERGWGWDTVDEMVVRRVRVRRLLSTMVARGT